MVAIRKFIPFSNRLQWETIKTIWLSLSWKEVIPFLLQFTKARIQLEKSDFWQSWKLEHKTKLGLSYQLDFIAFYQTYKLVCGTERALIVILQILRKQSAEVFWETVNLFRSYGVKLV